MAEIWKWPVFLSLSSTFPEKYGPLLKRPAIYETDQFKKSVDKFKVRHK